MSLIRSSGIKLIALNDKPLQVKLFREFLAPWGGAYEAFENIAKSAPFGNGYLEKIEKCKTLYIK